MRKACINWMVSAMGNPGYCSQPALSNPEKHRLASSLSKLHHTVTAPKSPVGDESYKAGDICGACMVADGSVGGWCNTKVPATLVTPDGLLAVQRHR